MEFEDAIVKSMNENETGLTRRQLLLAALAATVAPVGKLVAGLTGKCSLPREISFITDKSPNSILNCVKRLNNERWCGHPPETVMIYNVSITAVVVKKTGRYAWRVTVRFEAHRGMKVQGHQLYSSCDFNEVLT